MIREAEPRDFDALMTMALRLFPDSSYNELKDELLDYTVSDIALVLVEERSGRPVAFAVAALRQDYVEGAEHSPVGYLEAIYVEAAYRASGIARELLARCERWAMENDCREFASDCEIENEASRRFHESVGFSEANRVVCFIKKLDR